MTAAFVLAVLLGLLFGHALTSSFIHASPGYAFVALAAAFGLYFLLAAQ